LQQAQKDDRSQDVKSDNACNKFNHHLKHLLPAISLNNGTHVLYTHRVRAMDSNGVLPACSFEVIEYFDVISTGTRIFTCVIVKVDKGNGFFNVAVPEQAFVRLNKLNGAINGFCTAITLGRGANVINP
jgi:hypothetical protein